MQRENRDDTGRKIKSQTVVNRKLHRVFRNLWDSLRELIVRLKITKKKSYKYMSYLSSFMRYNEFYKQSKL